MVKEMELVKPLRKAGLGLDLGLPQQMAKRLRKARLGFRI